MAKGNHRPGGGIKSRVNVETKVRTGRGAKAQSPAAVNQLGGHVGSHVTNRGDTGYRGEHLVRGPGYNPAPGYGNAVALNVGGGGPGKGYKQYGQAGSQGCHGTPAQGNPPPAGELFPGWGPNSKR
jgi:hypothetical protein